MISFTKLSKGFALKEEQVNKLIGSASKHKQNLTEDQNDQYHSDAGGLMALQEFMQENPDMDLTVEEAFNIYLLSLLEVDEDEE